MSRILDPQRIGLGFHPVVCENITVEFWSIFLGTVETNEGIVCHHAEHESL